MIEAEYHPDMLLLLPHLCLAHGECDCGQGDHHHWSLSFGWLVFSVHLYC